jgi:hypothetical protein
MGRRRVVDHVRVEELFGRAGEDPVAGDAIFVEVDGCADRRHARVDRGIARGTGADRRLGVFPSCTHRGGEDEARQDRTNESRRLSHDKPPVVIVRVATILRPVAACQRHARGDRIERISPVEVAHGRSHKRAGLRVCPCGKAATNPTPLPRYEASEALPNSCLERYRNLRTFSSRGAPLDAWIIPRTPPPSVLCSLRSGGSFAAGPSAPTCSEPAG